MCPEGVQGACALGSRLQTYRSACARVFLFLTRQSKPVRSSSAYFRVLLHDVAELQRLVRPKMTPLFFCASLTRASLTHSHTESAESRESEEIRAHVLTSYRRACKTVWKVHNNDRYRLSQQPLDRRGGLARTLGKDCNRRCRTLAPLAMHLETAKSTYAAAHTHPSPRTQS